MERIIALMLIAVCLPLTAEAQTRSSDRGQRTEARKFEPGRYRIVQTDGKEFIGEVEDRGDSYVVTVPMGRGSTVVTIKKSTVRELVAMPSAGAAALGEPAEETGESGGIDNAELQRILGPSSNFAIVDELSEGFGNAMEPAPMDEDSVQQMKRIAGPAAQVLTTDHFVLVYTSSREQARKLGSRLQSTYRWNIWFMEEQLKIPSRRPDYKLEIYFFGTHREFGAYAARELGMTETGGLLGFYTQGTNRSAFFEMETFPPFASLLEVAKDKNVDHRRRDQIRNVVNRNVEYNNLEVVQHEAAHHIHFNIGMFSRRVFPGRWVAEGMAVQFEVPPSRFGAGMGAINHSRLRQYRMIWGDLMDRKPAPHDFVRDFLFTMPPGAYGGQHYSLGWAKIYYLRRQFPEGFAKFMRSIAEWEEDTEITPNDMQKMFEENFGSIDEAWVEKFAKFMRDMQLRTSELPPDLP